MRKLFYNTIILLAFIAPLRAQQWEWALNNTGGKMGSNIGCDKNGNIYVTGEDSYTTGGSGSYYYPMFYKFDASGNLLIKDTLNAGVGKAVTDKDGNTYMLSGSKIIKLDNTGNQLWLKLVPNVNLLNLALYPSDGIVIVGRTVINNQTKTAFYRFDLNGIELWSRLGDFLGGGAPLCCDSNGNTYWVGSQMLNDSLFGLLAKIDMQGNLVYTKKVPNQCVDIIVSDDLSIYLAGMLSSYPTVINGQSYNCGSLYSSIYLIKYDQLCTFQWAKVTSCGNAYIELGALAFDKENSIYLCGTYSNIKVDNFNLQCQPNRGALFVMKTENTGNIKWLATTNANVYGSTAYPKDMIINSNDEILVTGSVRETHTFGTYTLNGGSIYPKLLVAKLSQPVNVAVTEISKSENNFNFNIFPNPAGGIFQISCVLSEKCRLQLNVLDSKGQKVYEETISQLDGEYSKKIDLSKHAKGVYFIEVIADRKRSMRRIILD